MALKPKKQKKIFRAVDYAFGGDCVIRFYGNKRIKTWKLTLADFRDLLSDVILCRPRIDLRFAINLIGYRKVYNNDRVILDEQKVDQWNKRNYNRNRDAHVRSYHQLEKNNSGIWILHERVSINLSSTSLSKYELGKGTHYDQAIAAWRHAVANGHIKTAISKEKFLKIIERSKNLFGDSVVIKGELTGNSDEPSHSVDAADLYMIGTGMTNEEIQSFLSKFQIDDGVFKLEGVDYLNGGIHQSPNPFKQDYAVVNGIITRNKTGLSGIRTDLTSEQLAEREAMRKKRNPYHPHPNPEDPVNFLYPHPIVALPESKELGPDVEFDENGNMKNVD